ncbi:MAG TPA: RNA polymerase subunit sigma-24 [Ruminococcus sp.]|nr:RNA polymerase subunit sigma-24 [Ruminococcus sp.]
MDNGASSYRRFLNGDNDAFVQLVREFSDGLTLFINTIINDMHIAEEAADDVFIRLYADKPKFREGCSFKTWLYAIGRNTALNYLKKIRRRQYAPLEDISYFSDETDIESEYISDERNKAIHQCIKALYADHAQVLFLIYFEGLTNQEAARVMGKTSRQVTQLLYRAKIALKEEMARRGISGQI